MVEKETMNPDRLDHEFVKVCHLTKRFGKVEAVNDVSFTVSRGDMISLLGPSGCGKTTTLRCVAGLDTPNDGRIMIGGMTVSDPSNGIEIPPEKRSIGMVFQSYAIWPHMNVFQNVAFPLKLKKMNRSDIQEKVSNTLNLVGLGAFSDRPATDLSGGQQQRVALARALVAEPHLVLFDEPLSNLDAKLRDYMREELLSLQKQINFTAIYVTHDQREALALSDHLIIMKDGRVDQIGRPDEVYNNPRTSFVADFMGASNTLEGSVVHAGSNHFVMIQIKDHDARFVCRGDTERLREGMTVKVSFRPEATGILTLKPDEAPPANLDTINRLSGVLKASLFLGEYFECTITAGHFSLKAISQSINMDLEGAAVVVTVARENCIAIPSEP
jgi:iron(III) transport system ATP-binding protein